MNKPKHKIKQDADGKWSITNTDTGEVWNSRYNTAEAAFNVISYGRGGARYHAEYNRKIRDLKRIINCE